MTAITIKDPISNHNVTVNVISSVDLVGETYSVVSYTAQTSAEVDCTFAIIESDSGVVCQNDWQGAVVSVDEITECEWLDCTPNDESDECSITEAAEMLGLSRQRVHILLQNGQLEGRKVGNAWIINRDSVEHRMK